MTDFVGHGRTTVTDPADLVPVDDYLSWVVRSLRGPRRVVMPTTDAVGLVLTAEVRAVTPLPPFTNSAMDGWAVRAEDVATATGEAPVVLDAVGAIHAGKASPSDATVEPGRAVAVMTGAPVPEGADAIVPVELTSRHDDDPDPGSHADPDGNPDRARVAVHVAVEPGRSVRRAGEELRAGSVLVPERHRLTPRDVALLLATGVHEVRVVAPPDVAVLTTGDELVAAGGELAPGQIHDSNGPMLAAALAEMGCVPTLGGPVPDTVEDLVEALGHHAESADLVILSGGVSAGEADHVAAAIGQLGEVQRNKLAMQPGMPQAIGRIGTTPVVGLPGNPVSTFVSFEVLVRPALRILQGRTDLLRPQVTAVLDEAVTSPVGKRSYLRVRIRQQEGQWYARPAGGQGSHMLGALSRADGLAVVPVDVARLEAGQAVLVHLLVA